MKGLAAARGIFIYYVIRASKKLIEDSFCGLIFEMQFSLVVCQQEKLTYSQMVRRRVAPIKNAPQGYTDPEERGEKRE